MMITPNDIQNQCSRWWKDVLLGLIENKTHFPKDITRIGKVTSKDILNKISEYKHSIHLLKEQSKTGKKLGYTLITTERHFDKIGLQSVPEKVVIDSLGDYLYVTQKEKECQIFLKNLNIIRKEIPALVEWVVKNPLKLIEHDSWIDTLKVCQYFLLHPKPNLYIRQLPIEIHTKYIAENRVIIQSLLDFLIPEHVNSEEKDFEKRFNLLSKEQLIRIRFLDTDKSPLKDVTDISFTERELKNYPFKIDNVFITENLMNFLTLPFLKNSIAVWSGGGFNISYLRNIEWLKGKQFYYWGDIDVQGFQILNQCRTYFPNTISAMMDRETLNSFQHTQGVPAKYQRLKLLTEAEAEICQYVAKENIRLEQERITQKFAEERIKGVVALGNYARPRH